MGKGRDFKILSLSGLAVATSIGLQMMTKGFCFEIRIIIVIKT